MSGTNPAPAGCTGGVPASGTYTLHGLPADVLPDGHVLIFARARHYDPQLGRWLQRDPLGYVDGPNLYEAFGGNALVNVDPEGTWKGPFDYLDDFLEWLCPDSGIPKRQQKQRRSPPSIAGPREFNNRMANQAMMKMKQESNTYLDVLGIRTTSDDLNNSYLIVEIERDGKKSLLMVPARDVLQPRRPASPVTAKMPEHNCGALDTLQNLSGLTVVGIPVSAGIGTLHGAFHQYGGDDLNGSVRIVCALVPALPIAAATSHAREIVAAITGSEVAEALAQGGKAGVQLNKAMGDAWERELIQNVLPQTQTSIQPQITIMSNGPSGLRVRLDAVGTDAQSGLLRLSDGKASVTAPLTPNQTIVYPELELFGGTVAEKGKPPYVGGIVIPPTQVEIIRKP